MLRCIAASPLPWDYVETEKPTWRRGVELGSCREILFPSFSLELAPVFRTNQRSYDGSMEITNKVYLRLGADLDESSRTTPHFLQPYHSSSENSLSRKMEGYAKLSSVISTDSETAIYRKFGALNAQNLLYYQAELLDLEDDLNDIASKDRNSQDSEKREFAYNWAVLSHAADGKDLQLKKFMKIRKTLKEYNSCLIQQAMIAKLEPPSSYALTMLQRWLDHPSYGNEFLCGLERNAWDEKYKHDLVSMPNPDTQANKDLLSSLFLGSLQEHYHMLIGRHYKKEIPGDAAGNNPMIRYKNSNLLRIADVLSTIISSALPIAAIITLNFIDRMIIRLVAIALFTMTVSLILTIVTNARRVEIFAATAA